jgi:hypothetical protein
MKLDAIPVFKPNQALTADHLNDLREFLDQEDRLTRRALIGIGVLCGFRLDVNANADVLISKGVAVTSEGHLIAEDAVVCDRFVPYTVPLPSGEDVPPDQVAEARYPFLFPDGETQIDAWELLTTEATVPAGETPPEDITSAFLADKTVMLFLEMTEESLKNCSINDCSDKGAELQYVLRRLLVRRADADAMMMQEAVIAGFPTDRANHPSLALKYLRVEDIGLARNGIGTYPALFARILQIAARLGAELPQALKAAYGAYQHLLEDLYPAAEFPEGPFPDDYFGNLWGNLAAQPFQAQYFYDYMLDAALAYNAFVDKARALDCECLPNPGRFPKHVLLGDPLVAAKGFVTEVSTPAQFAAYDPLKATTGFGQGPRPTRRRTPWTPACASPLRDDLRALFHRLTLLGHAFQLRSLLQEEIRVTPSRHDAAPLGARCIPPYYAFTVQSDLFRVWSPEKTRANLLSTVYSHQFSKRDGEHPYLYRIDGEDFHAVAGHVGKSLDQAIRELIVHKRVLGLDFAIEPVWMGLALADDGDGQKLDAATRQRALQAAQKLIVCRMGDFEVVLLTLLAALFAFLVFIVRALGRQLATDHVKVSRLSQLQREAGGAADTTGRELAAKDIARLTAIARMDALRRPDAAAFAAQRLDPKERRENRELSKKLLGEFREKLPEKGTATKALAGDAGETSIAGIYLAVKDEADGGSLFERTRDRLARLRIGTDNPEAADRVFNAVALVDAAETLMAKASVRSLAQFDAAGTEAAYVDFSDRLEVYAKTAPADPEDVDRTTAASNMAIADYAPAVAAQTATFSSAGLLGEAQRRILAIFQDLTLAGYAQRHPGLEHRAGVPKGGTLVLAYAAKAELVALMRRAGPRLDSLTDQLKLSRLQGSFAEGLAAAAAELLRASGPRGEDPLSDFVVLADFCLPSKCCDSDCSDVVLAEGLPENLFDLDKPGRMAVDPIIPNGTPPTRGPAFQPGDRDALGKLLDGIGVRPGRFTGVGGLTRREQPVEPARPTEPDQPSRPDRPAERRVGAVAGKVTGAGSAATTPIPEAKVTATDRSTRQATAVPTRNGEFKVKLPAGKYLFAAEAEGFETVTQDVEVIADETVEVALRLKRAR